ncbi:MAG: RNA methyltransferase [Rikenellaceae bacterium]|jgi:TrmH family RNA methyltransferase|nr:RNA methyltransferase [Rikenellaceae bacterium]
MTRAEIDLVRSLGDKRARTETGLFVAEGEKLVRELLASSLRVQKIYFTEGEFSEAERVSPKEMERLSHLKTATSCLAVVEIPKYNFDAQALKGRLTIALDEVQNPGNVGTIIRLADWFGVGEILCSESSADCFNPKVVQATMGAITRVRVHYGDLPAMLSEVAEEGIPVFGTFLEGENIYAATLPPEGVIVLGNEGKGISGEVSGLVSHRLFIPPYPADYAFAGDRSGRCGSESLNVAIAAAVTIAEFRRRQL